MAKSRKETIKNKNLLTKEKTNIRPPVVAILGHVDHGKTSLLDNIRKSHVVEKEQGGITQHIGAYQIEYKRRKITFIDTPGHEAFSAMRARGGQVSDLAVLVVAVDDGVMPQTRESIAHIKAAGIPFIVAVSKIDLPGTNMEKVKRQLSEAGVLVEGYGGDVVVAPVSAKTGEGVEDLLEMINLIIDMQELKDTKNEPFGGVIIEARLDKFKGSVATVLVKKGVLSTGSLISTTSVRGKVKALIDHSGKNQTTAYPSTPIEVLGFESVPKVGELVKGTLEATIESDKRPQEIDFRRKIKKPFENEISLIVKADVAGSLEAITNSLESLNTQDQKVKIYFSGTGDIIESDVLLASATSSLIIGFNVSITKASERLAAEEKVLIRRYSLIYELLDELKEGLTALSKSKEKEEILGEASILRTFKIGDQVVVGCKVIKGRINKNDTVIVQRDEKELTRSRIISMKHRQSDINEAREGEEFGLVLEKKANFAKGDIILAISHS
ncbi:translation initiation factor IF-2 [Patescibacteria group bacterium]|nr:translation initiation factor IF-2 [Patescibacteria group bacterium]